MYIVVEFHETFEYFLLCFLRYAVAGVLTVDVEALVLLAVTHLDVSLVGVFGGIGDKVGNDLLEAAVVNDGREAGVRILFQEFYSRGQNLFIERLADVVEGACEVDFVGFDTDASGIQ